MNNYYIALYNKRGEEIKTPLCPTWYGISEDMMRGICVGLKYGYGRKTAVARAYTLNADGTPGRLVRAQY